MSTREDNLMGKSQFLLLNPNSVRAHREAVAMIGIWKVRISIRARRNNSFHNEAGYMTDALFLSYFFLLFTAGPYMHYALELMEVQHKTRNTASDLVFPSPSDRMRPWNSRTSWVSVLKKANIQDFRFRDLRHSCASYLAMNGASLAEIAEVLGHKTLQMVKRYAHLSEAHTAKVVQSMNERIFG